VCGPGTTCRWSVAWLIFQFYRLYSNSNENIQINSLNGNDTYGRIDRNTRLRRLFFFQVDLGCCNLFIID
jgi:hypothetical protein